MKTQTQECTICYGENYIITLVIGGSEQKEPCPNCNKESFSYQMRERKLKQEQSKK